MVKELALLKTPCVLNDTLTNREEVIIYADAAGRETAGACISAIVWGLQEVPLLIQKRIEFSNTDLQSLLQFEEVADDIALWEILAVNEVVEELRPHLENKYIRVFVDNSQELFGLIAPTRAKKPLIRRAAIVWNLALASINCTPYVSYVSSPRNIADLWTRLSIFCEAQQKMEKHVKRVGEGNPIRVKKFLELKNEGVCEMLKVFHEDYCKRHGIKKEDL